MILMKTRTISQVIAVLSIVFGFTLPAFSDTPTADIKKTTDKILSIVTDPALKAPEKKTERQRLIRAAVDERFDWQEFSRRSLATHWKERTDAEKKEFVYLFGKLLERTYISRVESYSGEKVSYVREAVKGIYGIVQVEIVTQKNTVIAVDYRVRKKGYEWLVYDVIIDGISFIKNYRSQFNIIIKRSSYQELVKKLKGKFDQE